MGAGLRTYTGFNRYEPGCTIQTIHHFRNYKISQAEHRRTESGLHDNEEQRGISKDGYPVVRSRRNARNRQN